MEIFHAVDQNNSLIDLKQAIKNHLVGSSECNIGEECQLNIDEYSKELLDEISNYAKVLKGHKTQVRFSPRVMRIALGLYMKSSSGYEAFKSSNLRIMPSSSRLKQIKSNMNVHEGFCPKIYADFHDNFVSKKQPHTV